MTQKRQSPQRLETEAAGKRTVFDLRQNKEDDKVVAHLQNSLSALQMDRERVSFYFILQLEIELQKVTSNSLKSKNNILKRNELELDLEIMNKNIHNIKQKLKEIGAL